MADLADPPSYFMRSSRIALSRFFPFFHIKKQFCIDFTMKKKSYCIIPDSPTGKMLKLINRIFDKQGGPFEPELEQKVACNSVRMLCQQDFARNASSFSTSTGGAARELLREGAPRSEIRRGCKLVQQLLKQAKDRQSVSADHRQQQIITRMERNKKLKPAGQNVVNALRAQNLVNTLFRSLSGIPSPPLRFSDLVQRQVDKVKETGQKWSEMSSAALVETDDELFKWKLDFLKQNVVLSRKDFEKNKQLVENIFEHLFDNGLVVEDPATIALIDQILASTSKTGGELVDYLAEYEQTHGLSPSLIDIWDNLFLRRFRDVPAKVTDAVANTLSSASGGRWKTRYDRLDTELPPDLRSAFQTTGVIMRSTDIEGLVAETAEQFFTGLTSYRSVTIVHEQLYGVPFRGNDVGFMLGGDLPTHTGFCDRDIWTKSKKSGYGGLFGTPEQGNLNNPSHWKYRPDTACYSNFTDTTKQLLKLKADGKTRTSKKGEVSNEAFANVDMEKVTHLVLYKKDPGVYSKLRKVRDQWFPGVPIVGYATSKTGAILSPAKDFVESATYLDTVASKFEGMTAMASEAAEKANPPAPSLASLASMLSQSAKLTTKATKQIGVLLEHAGQLVPSAPATSATALYNQLNRTVFSSTPKTVAEALRLYASVPYMPEIANDGPLKINGQPIKVNGHAVNVTRTKDAVLFNVKELGSTVPVHLQTAKKLAGELLKNSLSIPLK